jgi:hypothetical protein
VNVTGARDRAVRDGAHKEAGYLKPVTQAKEGTHTMAHAFNKIPGFTLEDETCILSRPIAAIQTTTDPANVSQLGVIAQLPRSVKLTLLGRGFNDRTVKVRCQQAVYFVFLEDLEKDTQEAWAAALIAGHNVHA